MYIHSNDDGSFELSKTSKNNYRPVQDIVNLKIKSIKSVSNQIILKKYPFIQQHNTVSGALATFVFGVDEGKTNSDSEKFIEAQEFKNKIRVRSDELEANLNKLHEIGTQESIQQLIDFNAGDNKHWEIE